MAFAISSGVASIRGAKSRFIVSALSCAACLQASCNPLTVTSNFDGILPAKESLCNLSSLPM